MSVTQEYRTGWEAWRATRIAELTAPHGWIGMISQDWLTEGTPHQVSDIPGTFTLIDGRVIYTPGEWDAVRIDGVRLTEPTEIPPGHKYTLIKATYDGKKVETVRRTAAADGSVIFGVRVRDPKEAERRRFDSLPTFPLDEGWVIPARFTRRPEDRINVPTVENGALEERTVIGGLTFELNGTRYSVSVSGRPDDETGEVKGSVHFADLTSGKETYGNGRLVPIPHIEESGETVIDFNRAHSFPCAFTNYVTCPLVPGENRIDVAITAGEKTPPTHVERIQTYLPEPVNA